MLIDMSDAECPDCLDTGMDARTGEPCTGVCFNMHPSTPDYDYDWEYRAWMTERNRI